MLNVSMPSAILLNAVVPLLSAFKVTRFYGFYSTVGLVVDVFISLKKVRIVL